MQTSINPNPTDAGVDLLAGLRTSLTFVARNYAPEDIVRELSDVLDDRGDTVAQRHGDYSAAANLKIIARYLARLDSHIENYDPTED